MMIHLKYINSKHIYHSLSLLMGQKNSISEIQFTHFGCNLNTLLISTWFVWCCWWLLWLWCWKFRLNNGNFFSANFCKTSRNHERTCAKKKRKRAIDEQRVLLSVCKFTRIPFGLFSRLQSPYISCSLSLIVWYSVWYSILLLLLFGSK